MEDFKMSAKTYYMLTKPGIILGNVVTTAGGFALASKNGFNFELFLVTVLGLALVIASAGIFNNYIDRKYDAKMARTKDRPLASGQISTTKAIAFATLLGGIGAAILGSGTNVLTLAVAMSGFAIYLLLYAFMKYRSFYGTIVGSLAGAVPPVAGYTAVSDRIDTAAIALFLIMVLWQMPHFFAIAIYRLDEYKAAEIPVLPATKGIAATKTQMVLYILAFIAAVLILPLAGYTGSFYAAAAAILAISWLWLCLQGLHIESSQDKIWAKKMFAYSLVVIMGIFLSIPVNMPS
jgi:protoheme IX farnesyltransferase